MIKLQKKIELTRYTTFKVGGSASYFVDIQTKSDLRSAINFSKTNKLPFFIIGEGSDILVSDKDFKSVVIRLTNKKVNIKNSNVISDAGVKWDNLVDVCVADNLQGIECLSGIPGTVGASPVQNIGAYGQELKDTFVKAEVYDVEKNEFIFLNNSECNFGYRESIFKRPRFKKRYVIFRVFLRLNKNLPPNVKYDSLIKYLNEKKVKTVTLDKVRKAIIEIRHEKLPDPKVIPNAGSFFKNPIIDSKRLLSIQKKFPSIPNFEYGIKYKLFAGWLIEQCGWKGKRRGNVGTFDKNALVIVNHGKGTAKEIKELSENIISDVFKKFEVKLEKEVQSVNF